MNEKETLLAFLGWLTTRDEPVTFSARHDASVAVELIREFCEVQGFDEVRDGWVKQIVPMNGR